MLTRWVDPPPSTNYVRAYPAISADTGGNAVGVVAVNCTVPDCGALLSRAAAPQTTNQPRSDSRTTCWCP